MWKAFNYAWRLGATAASFSLFGIGGFILWIMVLPCLSLIPGDPTQKIRRAQRCIHYSFYFFIGFMHRIGVMTYEVSGLNRLNQDHQIIIANHPTLIDVVFLISRMPYVNCIVKAELWDNIFTRGPILYAGYISNRDTQEMIEHCVHCVNAGGSLIIFPEGTRSIPGQDYKFQRGVARIALQADAVVTPVVLRCTPSTLTKAEKWYQIPNRRFHLEMHVDENMDLDPFMKMQPESIAVRRLTAYLEHYFTQKRD
jgi:1-acyl-sn-glycerol-3-phosphate acyltransferase